MELLVRCHRFEIIPWQDSVILTSVAMHIQRHNVNSAVNPQLYT